MDIAYFTPPGHYIANFHHISDTPDNISSTFMCESLSGRGTQLAKLLLNLHSETFGTLTNLSVYLLTVGNIHNSFWSIEALVTRQRNVSKHQQYHEHCKDNLHCQDEVFGFDLTLF